MAVLTLSKARTIVRKAIQKARELDTNPMTVVVLDAGGHPIAMEREDGASPGRFRVAEAKAYGCVMLGMPGSVQRDRAEAQAYFMAAANGVFDGKLLPVPGGVLVRDKRGVIVGAVGVTGDTSELDAECALFGIDAAGLTGAA